MKRKTRLAPKQGTLSLEDDLQGMKPKFPAGEELARHFAQGKQTEKRVGVAVAAWAPFRGGRRQEGFAARRGAWSSGFARRRCIKEG
jgi:hypothetical protein